MQLLAVRALARVEEVDDAGVDVLLVGRRPEPEPVLHDRPAVLDRVDRDLLDRVAREEAVRPGVEQLVRHVVALHRVVLERRDRRALEHVAAALGHQVDRETRRLHGDVAAAGGHLDLLERVEVEVRRRGVRRQVGDRSAFEVPLHVRCVPYTDRPTCWPDAEPPTLRPACTPGVMLMICHGSRAVGMFSRMSSVNVAPVVVFFVSTTGAAAETVTSSDICPISSFWSTGALKPVVMTTFDAGGLLEAAQLERHGERADRHAGELIRSAGRGGRDQRPLQGRAGHRHGHARQHAAGRVRDLAEDRANRLRVGRSGSRYEDACGKQDASEDSGHLSSSLTIAR